MHNVSHFSLTDWLYYLENRYQQEIQLGLERIRAVAVRLNIFPLNIPVITVSGTNGKGSTVAALEAIYQAAGYQVGTYTSPHLLTFNERICVNQQPITDEQLCSAFTMIEARRGSIPLTYFETTTLAALIYFKKFVLDVIILEVGMGGRLDATNIIDADLAIITTVDFDHQDYLGNTLEEIGYEKAGILRTNKPCIYADINPPQSVVNQARQLKASLYCLEHNYFYKTTKEALYISSHVKDWPALPRPCINLKAAVAAIMATDYLNARLPVTHSHWVKAMQTVSIPGRQQVIEGKMTTIFDVAHNPQAVSLLADFIEQYQPTESVHAIFSALKDKDLCGLIKPMRSYVDFWYPALLDGKRATEESELLKTFDEVLKIKPVCFQNPLLAYRTAISCAQPGDIIIVYGSFLTVSAIIANVNNSKELQ